MAPAVSPMNQNFVFSSCPISMFILRVLDFRHNLISFTCREFKTYTCGPERQYSRSDTCLECDWLRFYPQHFIWYLKSCQESNPWALVSVTQPSSINQNRTKPYTYIIYSDLSGFNTCLRTMWSSKLRIIGLLTVLFWWKILRIWGDRK